MINEEEFVSYFERLATVNGHLKHGENGRNSFFYIEDGYDLTEFDEKLRSAVKTPSLMLVADDGAFTDNNSEANTQEIEGEILIIGRKANGETIRGIRAMCLPIALDFLVRIKYDSKNNKIHPDSKRKVFFRIDRIPYKKIGPLNNEWYGYSLPFKITCPFSYSVKSGNWLDI